MRFGDGRGSYSLSELPGSPQVCVSHGSFVYNNLRSMGIGAHVHEERIEVITTLGFDYAICTVNVDNYAELKILKTHEWKLLDSFTSSATGHTVEIYGKRFNRDSYPETY